MHNWDTALHRGCDFGSCPRRVGAAATGGVPLPAQLQADASAVFGEAAGGAFTFTFSLTHTLLHAAWDKNMVLETRTQNSAEPLNRTPPLMCVV